MQNIAEQSGHVDVVYITGIMTRSGTNFLYNLLCLHPQCRGVAARAMAEDHFLDNFNLLDRYVSNVSSHWSRHGRLYEKHPEMESVNQDLQAQLFKSIGDGLLLYLSRFGEEQGMWDDRDRPKAVVTKTPSVNHLSKFFKLFPTTRLIIIVRDGRDMVESNVKSFGSNYEFTMRRWAEAANTILKFDEQYKDSKFKDNYLLIKYEDILTDLPEVMTSIFDFLDFDTSLYDFEKAQALPIFGSSENFSKTATKRADGKPTGWKVVEKSTNFQPKARWKDWPDSRKVRFYSIAAEPMQLLGYEIENCAPTNWREVLFNRILDLRWGLLSRAIAIGKYVEKTLYAITKARRDFRRLKMEQ
ncbi:sulfotransferase [Nodosilinea sp. LEGE 07088]|uniref:sulfotransferase family protein n=1 Tax=Nodosilinea sp. LEGE 07088 TaxID=2777968 RepID=UPI001880EB3B|nr:sulfotransferase [Nodosilinea sp. LEGE 07088]MBE9138215.1 sulfotransferase [Nodosilinea sp. LEGE 07088]